MKVYFISGLAADRRVFKYIELPRGYDPVYLDWIRPHKKETLQDYALRLASDIDSTEPFALVGFSLGGMMAAEITKYYQPQQLILISSVGSPEQLPTFFRVIGKLNIHKAVPVSLLKSASLVKRFFSPESDADKIYLRQAIRESDPVFIKWAINAILKWKMSQAVKCVHIHGNRDILLPCKYTKPTHLINKGGHMMILTHGKEISRIISESLRQFQSAE